MTTWVVMDTAVVLPLAVFTDDGKLRDWLRQHNRQAINRMAVLAYRANSGRLRGPMYSVKAASLTDQNLKLLGGNQ